MTKLKHVRIEDVKLDEKNANRGTKRGREFIAGSLEKYGPGRSILLDKNGTVIAGNKTLEAFRAAGGTELLVVPTQGDALVAVQREDLTINSRKAKELGIADNRSTELDLAWDPQILSLLNVDLSAFFSESEQREALGEFAPTLQAPEAQVDQAEELQKKWQTERDQIWQIGEHRLMCGDSTSESDVQALLRNESPTLCITDPPYGVGYDPNWRNEAAEKGLISFAARRVGEVPNDHIVDWRAAWKLLRSNIVYVWHAGLHASEVQQGIESASFEIRSQIIWAKRIFAISRGHYHWQHEPCWYAVRKGEQAGWIGDRSQTTLWTFDTDPNVAGGHSTQKPIECMAHAIRNHQGDVHDPFAGTGTTIVAAQLLNRTCYAMELNPAYTAVILERLFEMGLKPEQVDHG